MSLLPCTLFSASIFLLFLLSDNSANGLVCFQGQQNSTLPVSGSATECPISAISCTKSVEPSLKIATRGCQQTDCTLNGIISTDGVCQNSTSYPFSTYCCCYGDGCNSATKFIGSASQLLCVIFFTVSSLSVNHFRLIDKYIWSEI